MSNLGGGTILDRCFGAEDFDLTQSFYYFVNRDANNILEVTSGLST